jgi:PKD repeat protein
MLNRKIFALSLLTLSIALLVPFANAQPDLLMKAWTDKPDYMPGEKVVVHIALNNTGTAALTVENITVTYESWIAYVNDEWVGDQTIDVEKKAIYVGETLRVETTYSVPTDGRAKSTSVNVIVSTDRGSMMYTDAAYIEVSWTPRFMEQIVTLFTVQVVLLIVCTIIIAATIFLSARRPQTMWRREEAKPPAPM